MTNKKYYLKLAGVVVGIVAIILVVWSYVKSPAAPAVANPNFVSEQQNVSGTAANAGTPTTGTGNTAAPIQSPITTSKGAITFVSPATNDQWILQTTHTIKWNRAAGAPDGTISLIDATTGTVVGWIQQQILPQQTSFSWNTRDIFPSPTGPLKNDVSTGKYRIVLTFNSPNAPRVIGPAFSLISAAQAETMATVVAIQGASFSPASITVTQGTKLTFVNNDTVNYQIVVSATAAPFAVTPSASHTFDTSILSPASYAFYSTAYPSLRLSVTVKARTQ